MTRPPTLRTPGEGRTVAVVGDVYRFLATGEDTNGTYAQWEAVVPPGGGPPPHVHSREEEGFYAGPTHLNSLNSRRFSSLIPRFSTRSVTPPTENGLKRRLNLDALTLGFYVLEGEITFTVNGERVVATAGTFASMPAGTPHSFRNESDRPARMLITVAPAGLEHMFFEVGVPLAEDATAAPLPTPDEVERLLAVAPRYGIEIRVPQH